MVSYVIEHKQRGLYVQHVTSKETGKKTPSYSWKRANENAMKFSSQAEAQAYIDRYLPKRCVARIWEHEAEA